jgi:hypothetical protein
VGPGAVRRDPSLAEPTSILGFRGRKCDECHEADFS